MNHLTFTIIYTFFLLTHAANLGSEVCKLGSCQSLIVISTYCGYSINTVTSLTPTEAYCTCSVANFTAMLKPCLDCMAPYNIPVYTQSTWENVCPNVKAAFANSTNSTSSGSIPGGGGVLCTVVAAVVATVGLLIGGLI